jgi:hypothetical protein
MRASLQLRGAPLVVACAILLATAGPGAQRRNRGDNASFGAPVATNTIAGNPEAYDGKLVTVSAGVEQVLSKTVFVVDQRRAVGGREVKSIGAPTLVIAPALAGALDQKHYLLLRGQILTFDAASIEGLVPGYTLDLSPELGARYQGQPVLLATSVLDSTSTELVKQPVAAGPATAGR